VLDLAPVEVASRLRDRGGLVFFDSASENGDSISVVAAQPQEVLRGSLSRDGHVLKDLLAQDDAGTVADFGMPAEIVAGWVEYDGAFCFGVYEDVLVFRHRDASWHETGDLRAKLSAARQPQKSRLGPAFIPRTSRQEYCAMVESAQRYIAAGDIYQVNLAHRFSSRWAGDAFAFYESLRHYSPAPYGAFLELEGRAVLSASPESFLRMSGRAIRTRPIKGTRPRRADVKADEKSAFDLITSAKEIAELVMITDLERSDLGQVCEYGSVSARELLQLERYEHVFHLVSTIEGRLRAGVDHVSALAACFPGGSITGAPKRRAREIIAELELQPRGLYTGALGWFGRNGESQFNIAIRTAVMESEHAHFHVGAGIVADSVPEREWQETLDKAAGILLAAERFGTL